MPHPFDDWFKNEKFTLYRGADYFCQPHTMSIQLRIAARKRRKRISVFIYGPKLVVTMKGGLNAAHSN